MKWRDRLKAAEAEAGAWKPANGAIDGGSVMRRYGDIDVTVKVGADLRTWSHGLPAGAGAVIEVRLHGGSATDEATWGGSPRDGVRHSLPGMPTVLNGYLVAILGDAAFAVGVAERMADGPAIGSTADEVLRDAGFTGDTASGMRKGDITARIDDDWFQVERAATGDRQAGPVLWMGPPGLWKEGSEPPSGEAARLVSEAFAVVGATHANGARLALWLLEMDAERAQGDTQAEA